VRTGRTSPAPGPLSDPGKIDLPVSAGAGYCSIDCSRVGPLTPALLHRLATVCEQSAAAGVPARLVGASPSLAEIFALLAPGEPHTLIDARGGLMNMSDDGIARTVRTLIEHLKRLQVPELTAYVLRTLFEEVATNSKLHAGLPGQGELFWHLQLLPHKSVLVFADSGSEFDLTTWNPETGPVERDPGDDRPPFGIRLIKSLAQHVEYKRVDDRLNVLIMERDRR
jgi:anti-sigma regulatory factor (Ser/Thr protein kinase)